MLLASSAACTFFLDTPGELQATCAFENETGYCGACIVESCAPLLNTCCGDAECAPLLDSIDACASEFTEQYSYGDATVCGPLARLDEDPGQELKRCIAVACSEKCGYGDVTSASSGSKCDGGYVNACQCTGTGDDPGNLVECSPPPGGAVCCAYQAYPADDTHCQCRWYACGPTASGCSCSTSGSGASDRCDGTFCCLDNYGSDCRCGNTACEADYETRVAACTPAVGIGCTSDEQQVLSCSVRRMP